jgi:hypothetical protein
VTLDVAGRLPTLDELSAFLADTDPQKRSATIDRLLDSPDYANYFASKWSAILRNRHPQPQSQLGAFAFHDWLRRNLYENRPYDVWVSELLTASGSIDVNPAAVWWRQVENTEARVEDAAQLFLGQRIQCARCHHHPFEKWGQEDYYHLAAFFSLVETRSGRGPEHLTFVSRVGQPSAQHPKSGQGLPAAGLDAEPVAIADHVDPRVALVDWMTESDNPFFAQSLVNRYWKHFLGRGLVEPEDDLRVTNPPTNPALMTSLAEHFCDSGYDLKSLIRLICNSTTYQLDSAPNEQNLQDAVSYSRFYPKRLSAEVLLDCLDQIARTTTEFEGMPTGTRAIDLPDTSFNSYFLTVFGRPESATACECERMQNATLAQSLHLLNSKEIQQKLSQDCGLAATLVSSGRADDECVQEIYRRALSRDPSETELATSREYLQQRSNDKRAAYEDLIWALVNSKEFLFIH